MSFTVIMAVDNWPWARLTGAAERQGTEIPVSCALAPTTRRRKVFARHPGLKTTPTRMLSSQRACIGAKTATPSSRSLIVPSPLLPLRDRSVRHREISLPRPPSVGTEGISFETEKAVLQMTVLFGMVLMVE